MRSPRHRPVCCGVTLAGSTGRPIQILRLYSIFGPWEDPRRLLPTLIVRGLDGQFPPLVEPITARDYVYVDDAIDAFVAAACIDDDRAWCRLQRRHGRSDNVEGRGRAHGSRARHQGRTAVVDDAVTAMGHDRPGSPMFARSATHLGWRPRRTFEEAFAVSSTGLSAIPATACYKPAARVPMPRTSCSPDVIQHARAMRDGMTERRSLVLAGCVDPAWRLDRAAEPVRDPPVSVDRWDTCSTRTRSTNRPTCRSTERGSRRRHARCRVSGAQPPPSWRVGGLHQPVVRPPMPGGHRCHFSGSLPSPWVFDARGDGLSVRA